MHFLHRMSETNGQWVFFIFPIWEPGHNVVLVESVKSKRVTIFRKCKPKDLKCNAKYTFLLFYFGYILKGKKDKLSGSKDFVREKEKFYAGQLAMELQVTQQTVSRWEYGAALSSKDSFRRLSQLCRVSFDYFVDEKKGKVFSVLQEQKRNAGKDNQEEEN